MCRCVYETCSRSETRPSRCRCRCRRICTCCAGRGAGSGHPDPRDENGLPGLIDPRDENGLPGLIDPRDENGLPGLIDPRDENGLPGLIDPRDENGLPGLIDPRDENGLPGLIDPRDENGLPGLIDPGSDVCGGRRRPSLCADGVREADLCGGRTAGMNPSGFLILRLSPDVPFADTESLRDLAEREELRGLLALLEEYEVESTVPVVGAKYGRQVLDLEREAERTELPPLHSLTSYWRLDLRARAADVKDDETGEKVVDDLIHRLRDLPEVDHAYRELAATDPQVLPGDDPLAGCQGYLDPAPSGIDARWAWQHADGSGVALADLEQGWIEAHEDLGGPQLRHGDNRDGAGTYRGDHGTAVLGEVCASDSRVGVVGVAPKSAPVGLYSHYDAGSKTNGWVAPAIVAAIRDLDPGDVLLLEVQRSFLPTEIDDADFDAIRLAVAHGLVVVEAAGNGGAPLDWVKLTGPGHVFARRSCDFRDSGAIMVAAALSAPPHDRKPASNYGSRIDVYAWGDGVVSCGYGDLDPGSGRESAYTGTFANTSAASPIIAGAALLLQSRYEKVTGGRLSPLQVRAALSDPSTGTPQGGNVAGRIGVMPDLRRVFRRLGLVPQPFLRDRACEPDEARGRRFTSSSPDLALAPAGGGEPFADGFEGLAPPKRGDDAEVWVQISNDGAGSAEDVRASLYWSPVATLPTPDLWQPLGTTAPLDVPSGAVPTVAKPVTWREERMPEDGRCALVAVLDDGTDEGDLADRLALARRGRGRGTFDWAEHRKHLADRRLAISNVHRVEASAANDGDLELPFLLTGTPHGDRLRTFDFELVQHLPPGVRMELEVPVQLRAELQRGGALPAGSVRFDAGRAILQLPGLPRVPLCGVRLCAGARHRSVLRIGDARRLEAGHGVALRQLYAGREVGRITWRF